MHNEELKKFLMNGCPAEHVTGKGTGKITRIIGGYVSNELVEKSLNEIRAAMMVQDELDACQKMVLVLLNYT